MSDVTHASPDPDGHPEAQENMPKAESMDSQPNAAVPPPFLHRTFIEILLDPRSLQYLMIFGGSLLVFGLVAWLWAVGVFENKLMVAAAMGLGTVALLGGGGAILRFTRFEIAGRAITLLACLIMPLNLWFYHAQGLMTLEGHLWLAGVVCCALYAASAWILRQPMFVYVLAAGVTLTGLLILADEHVGKLWEIAAPSTLLVTLGLMALHTERAFAQDGPFSRKSFGMAFFWSGVAILSSGLVLLLGAQLAGWLYYPYVQHWGLRYIPEIADKRTLQVLALGLVLAGTYAYVYSDLVVRRTGAFLYSAVFTFMWAEVIALKVLGIELNEEVAIISLALTAFVLNLARGADSNPPTGTESAASDHWTDSLARIGEPMGILLCILPLILGLELHLRAAYATLYQAWPFTIGWAYAGAMALTAVSSLAGAHLHRRSKPALVAAYFWVAAGATFLAAWGLLFMLNFKTTEVLAPWMMLIPISYAIAARMYRGQPAAQQFMRIAHFATGAMILAVFGSAANLTPEHVFESIWSNNTNLLLAQFFGEAAAFYVLAAVFSQKSINIYLATISACGVVWNLLSFWQVGEEYYTLVFALVGLVLLAVYRLAALAKFGVLSLDQTFFTCGNALLSLSFVAASLLTLSRLAPNGNVHASLLYLLLMLIVSSLSAAGLVREEHWRRWYMVAAIIQGCLSFLVLNVLSELSIWEKMEIFSLSTGLIILICGHVGWYRERIRERNNDWTSISLFIGSVLAALPLIVAVLIQRSHQTTDWTALRTLNEVGILAIGLGLLGTGVIFKLRATTVAGGLMMTVYLLSLSFFIHIPEKLQTVAIYMMLGGGTFFVTAVLLSIHRDRLIALPGKIKRHEGVFRVLSWR